MRAIPQQFMLPTGVLLTIVCLPSVAWAGTVVTRLEQVGAATERWAVVQLASEVPETPTCAPENTIMSFDKTTAHGQDMLSIALTAVASGRRVRIQYSDTECGMWSKRTLITRIDIRAD